MNVLIDTNVVLDDILSRGANAEAARTISRFITDGFINGYLTANCLTDIFYIVSKNRDEALDLPMGDFEDALVVVCAKKANLNYIVTNDKGFLGSSDLSVSTISPTEFLLKFED